MKKIGLLGGISYNTSIQYYDLIMKKYNRIFNDINYPEIIIYSLSHGKFKSYEDKNDLSDYIDYILYGARYLESAGAELIAFAANSPHKVIEEIRNKINVPIISSLDSAVKGAQSLNIKKGLLLGIKFTMQSTYFQERFETEHIELQVPAEKEQDIIDDIISKELNFNIIKESSLEKLLSIIDNYSVDGVVIGCMRLPILLNDTNCNLPLVNTLDKHTDDIINFAISD